MKRPGQSYMQQTRARPANVRSLATVLRMGAFGAIALALGGCATSAVTPSKDQRFQYLFAPYTFDNICKMPRAKAGEPLRDYANRVEQIDFDCILAAAADLPPDTAVMSKGYIVANAYLALQSHHPDDDGFETEEFVRTTRLINHPEDRSAVYTVAYLLFLATAKHPDRAEEFEPCAKKIAFKALDLGYDEVYWVISRNESQLSGWPPDKVRCKITEFNEFLEKM